MNPTTRHDAGFPVIRTLANCVPLLPLLADFRAHGTPTTDYAQRAYDRRIMASVGRWVSLVLTVGILVALAFGSHGLLAAPALVITWLFTVNRFVWASGGDPSPRAALAHSHLVWWTLLLGLLSSWAALVALVFPAPFWGTVSGTATVVGVVFALGGAYPTAKAVIASQVPGAPDMTPYGIIQRIFGITDVALAKYIEYGALEARIEGGVLTAKIPVGPDALLEKRSDLDARVALKAAEWQVAFADAATDVLVLESVDEATLAQRDAAQRSGGLFAEHIGGGLDDLPVIDLSQELAAEPLPRL